MDRRFIFPLACLVILAGTTRPAPGQEVKSKLAGELVGMNINIPAITLRTADGKEHELRVAPDVRLFAANGNPRVSAAGLRTVFSSEYLRPPAKIVLTLEKRGAAEVVTQIERGLTRQEQEKESPHGTIPASGQDVKHKLAGELVGMNINIPAITVRTPDGKEHELRVAPDVRLFAANGNPRVNTASLRTVFSSEYLRPPAKIVLTLEKRGAAEVVTQIEVGLTRKEQEKESPRGTIPVSGQAVKHKLAGELVGMNINIPAITLRTADGKEHELRVAPDVRLFAANGNPRVSAAGLRTVFSSEYLRPPATVVFTLEKRGTAEVVTQIQVGLTRQEQEKESPSGVIAPNPQSER